MADPKLLAIDSIVRTEEDHDVHGKVQKITITCAEGARWSPDPQELNDTMVFVFHCNMGNPSANRAHNQSLTDLERMCNYISALAKAAPRSATDDAEELDPTESGTSEPPHPPLPPG